METTLLFPRNATVWHIDSRFSPYLDIFKDYLIERRYAPNTADKYLACITHFARWLRRSNVDIQRIDEAVVQRFLDIHLPHCHCAKPVYRVRNDLSAALGHLLVVLRANAAIAEPPAGMLPVDEELRCFDEHMKDVRGLAPKTRSQYLRTVGRLLFGQFADRSVAIATIMPDDIRQFIASQAALCSTPASIGALVSALRGYLRFRAFLKFAARRDLTSFHVIERALGVPMKRFERPMLGFLSREEMLTVLGQPGDTWTSQRDHLLLVMLYNTGARVSEIIGVRVADVVLKGAACVHLNGKGRKHRSTPLWGATVKEIRAWLRCNPALVDDSALLPNRNGQAMTRSNVAQRLDIAVARAAAVDSSLAKRRISPHTIRHATAMSLLQSGVAFNVIALWLGHESTTTTHRYVDADLAMKEKALARLQEPDTKMRRFHPPDDLMRFLQTL